MTGYDAVVFPCATGGLKENAEPVADRLDLYKYLEGRNAVCEVARGDEEGDMSDNPAGFGGAKPGASVQTEFAFGYEAGVKFTLLTAAST